MIYLKGLFLNTLVSKRKWIKSLDQEVRSKLSWSAISKVATFWFLSCNYLAQLVVKLEPQLPSPCTEPSQAFSVNGFRWRIWEGRPEDLKNSLVPRDPKRIGRAE